MSLRPFIVTEKHLEIGGVLYPGMDQLDFTGPFEVLASLRDSTFHVLSRARQPVQDFRRLILTPTLRFDECPQLDLLVVPGGQGQEALMDDEPTLSFLRAQFEGGARILSVCTGALVCGAAGLLRGVHATTHWSAFHLLPFFGAIPVNERVVVDGRIVTAAGVTSGIDAALRVAAILRGETTAQVIQLFMQYAPEPPFRSGIPAEAPPAVLDIATRFSETMARQREQTARHVAARLGIPVE
jgi:cyclohexyl-isocyanide hydratase